MGGVDVSAHGWDHGVVDGLQERRVDSGDSGVVDGVDQRSLVDQGSLDSRVVDQRGLESRVVDDGLVDSSSGVDQGGISLGLGLTLGDVGNSGGGHGLQAGEDLGHEGSGQRGVVDSVDQGSVVDQGSLDSRVVDQGSLHSSVVDDGLLDGDSLLSQGEGLVDHRLVVGDGVSVDQRGGNLLSLLSHREGLVDEGGVDGSGEGQGVGGVDQSRVSLSLRLSLSLSLAVVVDAGVVVGIVVVVGVVVVEGVVVVVVVQELGVRFRLSHGHGEKSENYKELHAEACLDCLLPTVIL